MKYVFFYLYVSKAFFYVSIFARNGDKQKYHLKEYVLVDESFFENKKKCKLLVILSISMKRNWI